MDFADATLLVVGCGFYGAVTAERLAEDLGAQVLVIDRRRHIGGNAYSEPDADTGVERHVYGSHIFHTHDEAVWRYVTRFTAFNTYRHKVLSRHRGKVYHIPINLMTINAFFGKDMTPDEARAFIAAQAAADAVANPTNLEEQAISLMGRPLYEAFVQGYTTKQWRTDLRELPASIIQRIPARFNYDWGYFDDPWQGIPLEGYTTLFTRLLAHPGVHIRLGVDYFDIRDLLPARRLVVFTGPIDRLFDYRHGRLGYRSLRFEHETVPTGDFQGTAVMNYAETSVPFTRIHEFRHYHPERTTYPTDKTTITREYSVEASPTDEPYYPVNTPADQAVLAAYQAEVARHPELVAGGRLGSYQYLDMDDAIAAALRDYKAVIKPRARALLAG